MPLDFAPAVAAVREERTSRARKQEEAACCWATVATGAPENGLFALVNCFALLECNLLTVSSYTGTRLNDNRVAVQRND